MNCYGPTTYSARVPTCRLRTTADAVYVTVRLRYRTQCEVGRVAKDGLRVGARNGRGVGGEVMPIEGLRRRAATTHPYNFQHTEFTARHKQLSCLETRCVCVAVGNGMCLSHSRVSVVRSAHTVDDIKPYALDIRGSGLQLYVIQ